jgi:hypothetical protein
MSHVDNAGEPPENLTDIVSLATSLALLLKGLFNRLLGFHKVKIQVVW